MKESLWTRKLEAEPIVGGQMDRLIDRSRSNDSEISRLQRQVDRLTLTCQSMWELLRDCSDLTEEHLEQKVAEVDLRDGSPDGRLGSTVIVCEACGKNTNSRRDSCVWCGGSIKRPHIFEG